GTTETSQILQAVAPSVNFPHQSVTDATDVQRPFTLRGLSPDQTLVLVNGWRRHQTAVMNTFAYGMPAGSSGVDMNTIPAAAIDRIEVLRDGASAQYGSDAIAGVVNVVLKEGNFTPFLNATTGRYTPRNYPDDGRTVDVNGGWGAKLGRGTIALFGEFMDRQQTNRAWADPYDDGGSGVFEDSDFVYNLKNTLNASLGPCLAPANPCAPGNDGILGNGDDPGIPNQTSFFAGRLTREEFTTGFNAAKIVTLGLPAPVNVGLGAAYRRERWQIERGELAS